MRYLDLDIKKINEKLKNKEIKPIDLVNEAFKRIEETDLNCFITLNKEEAIKQALELEEKEVDNILFGLPIAIKDNIITKGLRTTAASHILDDFIPVYDATVISKIKEKNMIIIGKTNMDEFAMGSTGETSYFGNTLNPWNKSLVPGGSSSGSAACVAARITPLSLGTDTGGSIRQPSSFCGLVGLKPTYGRVSRYGIIAFASSLDQVGPITRNVYENALLLNVISGYDKNDLTSSKEQVKDYTSLIGQDVSNLKIAVPNYYMSDTIDKTVRQAVLAVIDLLKEKGCQIDYVDIDYLEYAIPLYQVIALGEASSNLARFDGIRYGYRSENITNLDDVYVNSRSEGFGEEVKRRIMLGSFSLSAGFYDAYFKKAGQVRTLIVEDFKKVFADYDLILGPVSPTIAHDFGSDKDDPVTAYMRDILTIPVNLAGLPGMSIPCGFSEGMPIGLQLIGNYFEEEKMYQVADAFEKATDFHKQKPVILGGKA